jgi:hypothetical protein
MMNATDLVALQIRVAQLERAVSARAHTRRRCWLLPTVCVAMLLALTPLGLLAGSSQPFVDVDPASIHATNITLIRQAGLTTGCNPAANLYCPSDYVRRDEMASFLARTAGLGTNPPVVNALTAVSAQTATHAVNADNATNATTAQTAARAGSADTAANAGHATSADNATAAITATNAANAENANMVGGYAPNAFVRVARNGSLYSVTPLSSKCYTFTSLLTVSITAPVAGFVLVNGVAGAQYGIGTGESALFLRARNQSDTARTNPSPYSLAYAYSPGPEIETAAISWVFPVSAGAQTFVLEACLFQYTGSATINAVNPQVTALFVPFGPDGTGTLGEQNAPASPSSPDHGRGSAGP